MRLNLKEFALLVYLYVVAKDRTTLKASELAGSDSERVKKILKEFEEIVDTMEGKRTVDYVPRVVLEKRDDVGIFKDMRPEEIIAICNAADALIEEDNLLATSHLAENNLKPYGRTAVNLMDRIFYNRNMDWYNRICGYNIGKIFEGVSEEDYEGFIKSLRIKSLSSDGLQQQLQS